MSNNSWSTAVISAIIWNIIVTILKFIWFFLTSSWALLSESIHSFADTMNQSLLMVWLKKSQKKKDKNFDYGYWRERYFWAIISACWIFFIGCWITVYHWVETLIHPVEIKESIYIYFILWISFLIEWSSLLIAIKSIYKKNKWFKKSIFHADNASKAVIMEDSVAVLWIFIALISNIIVHYTWLYYWDSIGSIFIWLLLGFVAIFLIIENKWFLIWKALDEKIKEEIIELIESQDFIEKIIDFKSEAIDMNNYIIKCDVELNWNALIKNVNQKWGLAKEYLDIENKDDFIRFCVDFSDRIPRVIWERINDVEKVVYAKYPNIKYLDLELN